ncbi:MAG: DNA polymerase III subunit alpha, partial [Chloroflexi bacterium]|nr:DNA polymerase III subunit alpha [Chloroflexota bacterium]
LAWVPPGEFAFNSPPSRWREGGGGWATSSPHLTLLVESEQGYSNLCRLITLAHRETRRNPRQPEPPALAPELLVGHTDGLIVLSGCRSGEAAQLVDAGRTDEAREALTRLANLFGRENTFVELQHNLVQGDARRVARLAQLACELDLPVVATGNVHYHDRDRHRLQDAMVAIHHRATLESSHRLRRPNSEFFLRAPQDLEALFHNLPEAIANVDDLSQRCAGFNLADHRELGYDFPDFTRQEDEQLSSADDVLATHCWRKFDVRYQDESDPELIARARQQLHDELQLVKKHHLAGFFLIYRDLQGLATRVAREVRGANTVRGGSGLPPGRGRGSSVSSIICYLIGLSHVDPVRNRLFFRRFLNEDLQAVPDIDLDFARDIREQLILAVYSFYGHDHAALVCSFATYHLRSAVRDLGKVLGLPPAAIDKLAKLSEGGRASSVRAELDYMPELKGQAAGPVWGMLIDLAAQIDGFPRHVGQHVGGMIISSRPVIELVPVQPAAMDGRFICQWDKDSCDDARFIKIDFLALGMLSLVEECLEQIWQTRQRKVDLGSIPYDDPAVYDAICRGDTVGMFQIESRAQIQMLTRTQPRTLDDLAVQVAIVRPGPIVGGAVNPYVRRRELQRQDPTYRAHADHPMLDDLLADTLGIVLYQDQVLEVAMTMGGFSPGQADQFRRSMSRRRSREAMERFRERFLLGAQQNGVRLKEATNMFDKLCGFSEFGFPKSHAYAFAVLAYQSAWLRHHFAPEFYAALLNNQPMGFYAPHVLVGDARRHGLQVLRVSINRSGVGCTPGVPPPEARTETRGYLLLGLTTVRGIGKDLAEAMVAEREAHGPFRTLADLLRRTGLPRASAENLIAVGALAEFGLGRRELLWQLGLLLPQGQGTGLGARGSGARRPLVLPQATPPSTKRHLLAAPRAPSPVPASEASRRWKKRQLALELPTEADMVSLADMTDWERMVADYGLLGLSPSYHPLSLLRASLPEDVLTAAQVRATPDGALVRTAGLVVCRQRPGTAKGFVFLLIEDETGLTNVVVRPDLYEAKRSLIRGEPYVCIEGRVQLHSGSLNLLALDATSLTATARLPRAEVRHMYPGNPHDPREAAGAAATDPPPMGRLLAATPGSHDFA